MRRLAARHKADRWELSEEDLVDVLEVLKAGGLVVYPTETLYGLGVDPYDEEAMERLYRVKRRPVGEPIALAVADLERAQALADFSSLAIELWEAFMPGPITLILRARPEAPPYAVTEEGNVGLRMPRNDIPLTIAAEFGPVTTTSANMHGKPPPIAVEQAIEQLGEAVDLYIDAGPCPLGKPSTVVDLTQDRITVKREGAVRAEELKRYG